MKHKQLMDSGGVSKLHLAVFQGKQDKVRKLLEKGCPDINRGDKFGQTPLHISCHREGLLGCLKLLASHQANLEALDANGNTALHSAAGSGAAAAAEFLLGRGLSVADWNKDGHTPMDICNLHCPPDKKKSMVILLEGGAKVEEDRAAGGEATASNNIFKGATAATTTTASHKHVTYNSSNNKSMAFSPSSSSDGGGGRGASDSACPTLAVAMMVPQQPHHVPSVVAKVVSSSSLSGSSNNSDVTEMWAGTTSKTPATAADKARSSVVRAWLDGGGGGGGGGNSGGVATTVGKSTVNSNLAARLNSISSSSQSVAVSPASDSKYHHHQQQQRQSQQQQQQQHQQFQTTSRAASPTTTAATTTTTTAAGKAVSSVSKFPVHRHDDASPRSKAIALEAGAALAREGEGDETKQPFNSAVAAAVARVAAVATTVARVAVVPANNKTSTSPITKSTTLGGTGAGAGAGAGSSREARAKDDGDGDCEGFGRGYTPAPDVKGASGSSAAAPGRGGRSGGNGRSSRKASRQKQTSLQELHLAIFQGDTAKVEDIVSRGDLEALNEPDRHGQTPLHLACYKGSKAMTRLLVEGGANLEAVDVNGNGVVHAAVCDSPAVLAILIDHGVDVTVSNHDGLTPKRLCEQYCPARLKERMLQLLREAAVAQAIARARQEHLAQGQINIEAVYHQLTMLRSRLSVAVPAAPPSSEAAVAAAAHASQTESALLMLVEANVRVVEGQRRVLQDLESTAGRLERMFRRLHMRLDAAGPADVTFS